jgi:hypothetical protein
LCSIILFSGLESPNVKEFQADLPSVTLES